MIQKGKELLVKYREIVVYLIVGVMTTIVSWAACFLLERPLDADVTWQNVLINTFGWAAGVLFAYPLNRKWVFQSTNPEVIREFLGFASSRLSTWGLDLFVMWLMVNILHVHYWIAKICISSVLVTIANYVFSKVFIFKKKEGGAERVGQSPASTVDLERPQGQMDEGGDEILPEGK